MTNPSNPLFITHQWDTPICGCPDTHASGATILAYHDKTVVKRAGIGLLRELVSSLFRPTSIRLEQIALVNKRTRDTDAHWYHFVKLLGTKGLAIKRRPQLIKLLSLEFKVELQDTTRNPNWQNIKVWYHGTWDRYLRGLPRLGVSLVKFLSTLGLPSDKDFCKAVLTDVIGFLDISDNFELVRGDEPDAGDTFARWYTEHTNVGSYPSVSGSCMRYPRSDGRWNDAVRDSGYHCVEAYATPDIGMARLKDNSGNTMMRTMLNLKDNTFARVYSGVAKDEAKVIESFINELKDRGFTNSYKQGLKGCRVRAIEILPEYYLMPYLDGAHFLMDCEDDDFFLVSPSTTGMIGSAASQRGCNFVRNKWECPECHKKTREDKWYLEGVSMCKDCFDEFHKECWRCGCEIHKDNLVNVQITSWLGTPVRSVCPRCAQKVANSCDCCETIANDLITTATPEGNLCDRCLERKGYHMCTECHELTLDALNDDGVCPTCLSEAYVTTREGDYDYDQEA